jgi:hypothetical protein
MTTAVDQHNTQHDWLRQWAVPQEDRGKYTSSPWTGGYRWFRSPNVIPIEQWRKKKQEGHITSPP